MAKSVDYRGRGARMARRDEGAYCWYLTKEQRSQPGCIERENDRFSHSRSQAALHPSTERLAGKRIWDHVLLFNPAGSTPARRASPSVRFLFRVESGTPTCAV